MYLETIATTSKQTAKVFQMPQKDLEGKHVQTLFKNQGIYNGLLAMLILVATFGYQSKVALLWLMGYIILVALYGSLTSQPKILLMQGGPAMLVLLSCLF